MREVTYLHRGLVGQTTVSRSLDKRNAIGEQAIIKKYTDTITSDPVDSINLNSGKEIDAFLHLAEAVRDQNFDILGRL